MKNGTNQMEVKVSIFKKFVIQIVSLFEHFLGGIASGAVILLVRLLIFIAMWFYIAITAHKDISDNYTSFAPPFWLFIGAFIFGFLFGTSLFRKNIFEYLKDSWKRVGLILLVTSLLIFSIVLSFIGIAYGFNSEKTSELGIAGNIVAGFIFAGISWFFIRDKILSRFWLSENTFIEMNTPIPDNSINNPCMTEDELTVPNTEVLTDPQIELYTNCPACGYSLPQDYISCPDCGILLR